MTPEIEKTHGTVLDEYGEEWFVLCPHCESEQEFVGFFDSSKSETCGKCKKEYIVSRIYFSDESYIE